MANVGYWFARGLKQHTFIFSQFWSLEVQISLGLVLSEDCERVCSRPLPWLLVVYRHSLAIHSLQKHYFHLCLYLHKFPNGLI